MAEGFSVPGDGGATRASLAAPGQGMSATGAKAGGMAAGICETAGVAEGEGRGVMAGCGVEKGVSPREKLAACEGVAGGAAGGGGWVNLLRACCAWRLSGLRLRALSMQ